MYNDGSFVLTTRVIQQFAQRLEGIRPAFAGMAPRRGVVEVRAEGFGLGRKANDRELGLRGRVKQGHDGLLNVRRQIPPCLDEPEQIHVRR